MPTPEEIEAVVIGHSGYARQGLIDDITALVAAAWDEGYESAYQEERGRHPREPNPYRTERDQ